jgi:rhamnose transport system permease protein
MTSARETALALAIVGLAAALAATHPAFFSAANLRDIFLTNLPVLLVAIGATLVILIGDIDISCGSMFAVCSVFAAVLAKESDSTMLAFAGALLLGAMLGSINGAIVAYAGVPSIVVTLATMVALRDGLRWATGGAWITALPPSFQWFGFGQSSYPVIAATISLALASGTAFALAYLAGGRQIYAIGSNAAAARLAGFRVERVRWMVFAAAGILTALAAFLNSVRFNQVPSNTGIGLEMKVIAAVVIGGAAIRGGQGTIRGTLLGVLLLSTIGPALTFFGVTPYWERALQGAIILIAVSAEGWRRR